MIQQAVVEAHDTPTPQQRLIVTDRIRAPSAKTTSNAAVPFLLQRPPVL